MQNNCQEIETISEAYRAEQAALHEKYNYGTASIQWAATVANIINAFEIKSVLDYGAGRGNLLKSLAKHKLPVIEFQMYEPAMPQWSAKPDPAELVCSIDVAEHVEPEFTENYLDELQRLTKRIAFITIHCGPAQKVLSDGRNAHLVQQPPAWWIPKLLQRFDLIECSATPGGFCFMGRSKTAAKDH